MQTDHQEEFLSFAIIIAKEAGSILLSHYGKLTSISHKSSLIDLVTVADVASEKYICQKITERYPQHDIIAEEGDATQNGSQYRWVIDPLDGTTNFVHQLPIFAVSIGLQYEGKTILGAVYNPVADKCFWAGKDLGAFLNGEAIKVTSTNTLSRSLLTTGFPYTHDDNWHKSFHLFKSIYAETQGVRRLGAAALDFCFVAMGRFDGYWEFGLQSWDICAGAIILQEAGGTVTDWEGNEFPFSGERILATNSHIHQEMLKVIEPELF